MKYLISLPQNVAENFHELTGLSKDDWFASSDPESGYLGSGGGTVHLLLKAFLAESKGLKAEGMKGHFLDWLCSEKRIIIHAGGQSRRLPAYGPSGKILTPMPVLRWKKGQRLDQTLLDLQLPLLEKILERMPAGMNTLIASGDVLIRASGSLPEIPEKDVVAFGHWVNPELASRHGVFFCDRFGKNEFEFMLQKPHPQEIKKLLPDHLFMIDVGIWGLSDAAIGVLFEKSSISSAQLSVIRAQKIKSVQYYDLYGDFGLGLGKNPSENCALITGHLSSAVLPLPNGEFYHFGTSKELISSNLDLQNKVQDQREIIHRQIKPHPAVFIQNSLTQLPLTAENENIWIENSHLGKGWKLNKDHILTGVPENDWNLELPENTCMDFVPIEEDKYAIRIYSFNEKFQGAEQTKKRFPTYSSSDLTENIIIENIRSYSENCALKTELLSASELLQSANLKRVFAQRKKNRLEVLPALAKNYRHSIFYYLDLEAMAEDWKEAGLEVPEELAEEAPEMTKVHHAMFCSEVQKLKEPASDLIRGFRVEKLEKKAFSMLQEALIDGLKLEDAEPKISVHSDQVVWGRSPVRLDLGGGWTDTPPNCILNGGKVVNIAVELNGQAPLQVFVKPTKEYKIILRSIDLGVREEVTTFEELENFSVVGGAFSIPKAALSLAGIAKRAQKENNFGTLESGNPGSSPEQALSTLLAELGGGLELSMLVAVPKGSGLGTSSILAATVLGSLSDFYGLGWSRAEIGRRTLALEQMLTTGGGWQDQFGGIYPGLKMLETKAGFDQTPEVSWLPGNYFTDPEKRSCLLLYYTGITRVAKDILGEIVRGMFLNSNHRLQILEELEQHAVDLKDNLLKQDWENFGALIDKSWSLNQSLDSGTNPPEVQKIIDKIFSFMAGQKLLGAGGGGYMFIVAKNPASAVRIKEVLEVDPLNDRARFVNFSISTEGLVVTRS
jgi:galactokinase/mevalonate kinase-like predicted kinase